MLEKSLRILQIMDNCPILKTEYRKDIIYDMINLCFNY